MPFYRTVATLIANLARASGPEGVWLELRSAAAKFGFQHMVAAEIHGDRLELLSSTCHETTAEEMRALTKLAHNPLFARARLSDEPFVKSELDEASRGPARERTLGLPDTFEAMEAVIVPIHEEGLTGWICFAGNQDGVDARTLHTLAAMSYAAWTQAIALRRHRQEENMLSQREIECLRMVAAGHTDDQIGKALGITGRTVRFHVGNAKTKLGVNSRIQAIGHLIPQDLQTPALPPDRKQRR